MPQQVQPDRIHGGFNHTVSEAGVQYLSTQVANWGDEQEWGFWIGRRAQAFTAANQIMIWLYATEGNFESGTVDGYRILVGDDSGNDEILLQCGTDGIGTTILTSMGAITNGVTDMGFLVRVKRASDSLFTLYTSPLATASAIGASATDVPNSTYANVTQGSVTNTTYIPAAHGYLGVVAIHSSGVGPRAAVEFDQVYLTTSSGDPTITLSTASLPSFGTVQVGFMSAEQSYTVSASKLTDNIAINAPSGFEVSTTSGSGFAGSVVLLRSGGTVSNTAIYVRFVPTAAFAYSGSITHVSGGTTPRSVAVSRTGVQPIPFQVVFHETMGNVSGITSIAVHAAASGFHNDHLTFSGTPDLRATSGSNGYSGASLFIAKLSHKNDLP